MVCPALWFTIDCMLCLWYAYVILHVELPLLLYVGVYSSDTERTYMTKSGRLCCMANFKRFHPAELVAFLTLYLVNMMKHCIYLLICQACQIAHCSVDSQINLQKTVWMFVVNNTHEICLIYLT
jgi:hypothetical protein